MTAAAPSLRTNTAWCLLGNVVARGNIFFGLMILKHSLSPAEGDSEAGLYTVAWATAAAIFTALAQPVTTLHTIDTTQRHTVGDYLGLRLVLWIPAWCIIAIVAVLFGMRMGLAMAGAIVAAAGVKWSESLNETFYGGLQQIRRNDLVTHSQILRGGISLLAMLAAGLLGQGAAVMLTAMTLANLAVFFAHDRTRLWRLHHDGLTETPPALQPRFNGREFRAVLLTSLPLIGVVGLAMVNPNIPRYVLAAEHGKAEAGRFGMIVFFVFAMMQIVDAMGRAASPHLAAAYNKGQMRTFFALAGKLLAWMIPLGGAGILGGIVLGEWALRIAFGADAAQHTDLLVITMWVGWIYCFASMLGYIATTMHRFYSLLVATSISGSVALWLSLTWIPAGGIEKAILVAGVYCIASIACLSAGIVYAAITHPARKKRLKLQAVCVCWIRRVFPRLSSCNRNTTMADSAEPAERKPTPRNVKIAFALIIILAGYFIFRSQQKDLAISGWIDSKSQSLASVLRQAKEEDRTVVAFFVNSPPSTTARTIVGRIQKRANVSAVKKGKFLPIIVHLDGTSDALAAQYKITTLPTFVVFLPDGTERNRKAGDPGEVPFRDQLLAGPPQK